MKKVLIIMLAVIGFTGFTEEKQPVAYWNFDAITDGKITDATGKELVGTVVDGTLADGKAGKALVCNGTSTQVTFPFKLDKIIPNKVFTISVWLIPSKNQKGYGAVINNDGSRGLNLRMQGAKIIDFNTANIWHACVYKETKKDVKAYFVTASYDGKTAKLYINGQKVAEKENAFKLSFSENLTFAYRPYVQKDKSLKPEEFYNGMVDELKIWDSALTDEEVKKLFESYQK